MSVHERGREGGTERDAAFMFRLSCLFDLIASLQTVYTIIEMLIAAGSFTSKSCEHI